MMVNSGVGFLTFFGGDITAQMISMRENVKFSELEILRALQTGAFGAFMNGITLTVYYRYLERFFGSATNHSTVLKKALTDQVIYAPFCIFMFFGNAATTKMELNNMEFKSTFIDLMKNKFMSTFLSDCSFWPFVNLVNFKYIPFHFRPAFISFCQYIWQVYMSYVSFEKSTSLPTSLSSSSLYPSAAIAFSDQMKDDVDIFHTENETE